MKSQLPYFIFIKSTRTFYVRTIGHSIYDFVLSSTDIYEKNLTDDSSCFYDDEYSFSVTIPKHFGRFDTISCSFKSFLRWKSNQKFQWSEELSWCIDFIWSIQKWTKTNRSNDRSSIKSMYKIKKHRTRSIDSQETFSCCFAQWIYPINFDHFLQWVEIFDFLSRM